MSSDFQVKLDKIKDNPEMIDLVKATAVSLKKSGIDLNQHAAKVALCLDFSGSMSHLIKDGCVSEIIKRSLAQAIAMDDDGDIEVFAFGSKAKYYDSIDINTYQSFSSQIQKTIPNMGGTDYSQAIDLIESFYDKQGYDHPVFVIFITDGDTSNKKESVDSITRASKKPIFWQFVGIGAEDYDPNDAQQSSPNKAGLFARIFGSPSLSNKTSFPFLEHLDEMEGRHVDNAGFFAIKDPKNINPQRMFDLLNSEYPSWLSTIKKKNMI